MHIEAFLVPVKTAALDRYQALAARSLPLWQRHGALSVVEAVAWDAPVGEVTSFPRALLLQEDETVVWSFVTFPDRETRDRGMQAAMEDKEFMELMDFEIMDGKRMIWGSFRSMVAGGPVAGG